MWFIGKRRTAVYTRAVVSYPTDGTARRLAEKPDFFVTRRSRRYLTVQECEMAELDADLLARCAAGDMGALEAIYRRHVERVWRYAWFRTR